MNTSTIFEEMLNYKETHYNKDGIEHRVNGPSHSVVRNGKTIGASWKQNGRYHRTDGPSWFNKIGEFQYYLNGVLHREGDGPCSLLHNDKGIETAWYYGNKLHREDGPARILKDKETGELFSEAYHYYGDLHSFDDKPAITIYDNGKPKRQKWYDFGEIHRAEEKGPALINLATGDWTYVRYNNHHRLNGPAFYISSANGFNYGWCIRGKTIGHSSTKELPDELKDAFEKEKERFLKTS